ncbi:Transferring glycosyl group transferase [Quillaja saponaria]|uniref:Transferring glycosyl group transferase n=1 Tax=Quillaja saponaria TaxID=32244 RepID=A0AAD7L2I7_QUISA|nr:Transferring glycosyl group transferase [Quillaja saponaria]
MSSTNPSMSSTKSEPVQDPFKSWKFLLFPTMKTTEILLSLFLKAIIIISTCAVISLFFYFTFSSNQSLNPEYDFKKLFKTSNFSTSVHDEPTNISHILFGLGGSAKTWNKRRHYSELWWTPNITRGFVWLDRNLHDNEKWPETSPPYKVSSNTSRFKYTCWYGSRSAIRLARIVKESYELGLENVRWFVMGDDDTVFFTDNLVTVLAKYDHNQMYYIGGNSESVEQDLTHSYTMAYGGGGFAVSYPLAVELVKILDGCIDRYHRFYGSDQKVQACISEIGVPVTKELGFHQVDIRGNPYGLLAAHPVAPLVSLHHLDYLQPMFPNLSRIDSIRKLYSAYLMDPGRTLQQSFCYDLRRNWSVSVSWGFTVQLYPDLVTAKQLDTALRTFQSWRTWSDEAFTFNTRKVSSDPCKRPLVYFMDRVERIGGNGLTRTTYKRYVEGLEMECDRADYVPALAVQAFNVSAFNFAPDLWKKAPRRQCCEVINGPDEVNSLVQVKIRGCHHFESVTLP